MASAGCGGGGHDEAGQAGTPAVESPDRAASDGAQVVTQVLLTGSSTRVLAGPLGEPQGLDDFANGIEPWGPVVALHTVMLADQSVHVVKQLSSPDPFTAMYQLADGTLVTTNDPLGEIVQGIPSPEPQEITWTDVDQQTWNVYADEVLVLFEPTTTEQQIWNLISQYNLEVRFSWFEPLDVGSIGGAGLSSPAGDNSGGTGNSVSSVLGEGAETGGELGGELNLLDGGGIIQTGNAFAWFQFGFDPQVWPTLDAALAVLNANPLVDEATPSFTDAFGGEYAWPHSSSPVNDYYYNSLYPDPRTAPFPRPITQVMSITAFHIDTNPYIKLPCDYGYNLDTVIALIDTGVWRGHPDMLNSFTPVGVDCRGNQIYLGMNLGVPDNLFQVGMGHGTTVAGQINPTTNNSVGVASIAPRAKILPIRLDVKGFENGIVPLYSYTSMVKAIRALTFYVPKWQPHYLWDFQVKVVNYSVESSGTPYITPEWKALHNCLSRDISIHDRLYVAGAGNDSSALLRYPAAYPETLGVTGLWYDYNYPNFWREYIGSNPRQGSNYWTTNVYPVSGIYGFLNCQGVLPCTNALDTSLYFNSRGTSICAPQIAALAFDILDIYPTLTYQQVKSRIIDAVDENTARGSIAGVPDFLDAF